MIQYEIGCNSEKTKIFVKLQPVLSNKEVLYFIDKQGKNSHPVDFFTATTDMRDWIGNIREMEQKGNDVFCIVEGIYRGLKRKVRNIKLRFRKDEDLKIGERVMVTEHINVAGGYDMLATKIKLLDIKKPDLNFINIGWTDDKQCIYLRIDPYTGEQKECVGNPVR